MQLREFLASKYFDSGTDDIRVEALDRARTQGLDLPLTSVRARLVNDILLDMSGGQEEIPQLLDPDYVNEFSFLEEIARLVEYLFLQLQKWYCAVPIEEIPSCDLPAAVFILQTFVHSYLPLSLWDPGAFEFPKSMAKPELRASNCFAGKVKAGPPETKLSNKDSEDIRKTYFGVRYKLSQLLLHPTIDRPKDAVHLLEILCSEKALEYRVVYHAFMCHPQLFLHLIDARVLGGYFDKTTQDLISKAFDVVFEDPILADNSALEHARKRVMLHYPYVRAQRSQSGEPVAPPAAESLRRIENDFSESTLRQLLARADQPPHPVYEALGGEDWFLSRREMLVARKQQRCKCCGSTSSAWSRLRQCARCGSEYYCSALCQKRHWPLHKADCREEYNVKLMLRKIKKTEVRYALKRHAVWYKWLRYTHVNILLHGLALHRRPKRGRTHIIIREATYTPEAAQLRYRFTTTKCGVFRIDEAMSDIERLLEWSPGNGSKYFKFQIDKADAANETPVFVLSYGLGVKAVINTELLRADALPSSAMHEPAWRDIMNRCGDDPPAPL